MICNKYKYKKRYKILIIDDNDDILETVSYFLKNYNLNLDIHTVNKCEDVIKKINIINPHIILLDYYLNNTTSDKILLQIKDSIENYYIIGMSSENIQEKFLSLGAKQFLKKPFSLEILKNVLDETMKSLEKQYMNVDNCFHSFDSYPAFQDQIDKVKEELKNYGIDYMGLDMHTFDDDYILWKNDHKIWQEKMTDRFINDFTNNTIQTQKKNLDSYTHITSKKENFVIPIVNLKNDIFNERANIIGDRKNGMFMFIYDEKYKHKTGYTLTFKDSGLSVFNVSRDFIKSIIIKITSFNESLSYHFNKMVEDKKKKIIL
ncbi:hypothetical protein AB836_00950 [Rickettsiales bacterium (ex Bugula neritina AB1)]|nr:hypothetical protein AB836_00950 [Rickettsiales bacterium (ex Bugula neritina AB1)]